MIDVPMKDAHQSKNASDAVRSSAHHSMALKFHGIKKNGVRSCIDTKTQQCVVARPDPMLFFDPMLFLGVRRFSFVIISI